MIHENQGPISIPKWLAKNNQATGSRSRTMCEFKW